MFHFNESRNYIMDEAEKNRIEKWYDDNLNDYNNFCNEMRNVIEKIIKAENIPFQSITSRTKEKQSFLDKCERKSYKNPQIELTDFAGVRIIAYFNSDVVKICKLIEREFSIDKDNSGNKADNLKKDQVGYLSVHYIVKLNDNRVNLPENKRYKDMKFEIQVRTLLQHAWAEIEHDRNYKFRGVLPPEIQRRFYLTSGTLEMVDREFQCLSDEIDKYSNEVKQKTSQGNLNVTIDSTSLFEYMSKKFHEPWVDPTLHDHDKIIINELHNFGINTLKDLEKIIPSDYEEAYSKCGAQSSNFIGILRDIMIINDYKKYFEKCWEQKWHAINSKDVSFYNQYNLPIKKIMEVYGLFIRNNIYQTVKR